MPEKYQPSPEEIKKAEEMMTEKEEIQSEARKEGYILGMKGRENYVNPNISSKEISAQRRKLFRSQAAEMLDSLARYADAPNYFRTEQRKEYREMAKELRAGDESEDLMSRAFDELCYAYRNYNSREEYVGLPKEIFLERLRRIQKEYGFWQQVVFPGPRLK